MRIGRGSQQTGLHIAYVSIFSANGPNGLFIANADGDKCKRCAANGLGLGKQHYRCTLIFA